MHRTQQRLFAIAPLLLGGCVSSGTWSAWHELDATLASAEDDDTELRASARMGPFSFATCEEVALTAIATYPGLDAPRARARSALAMARSEGALPAPSARIQVWDFPIGDPSRGDREGMYMLGVAQELPPAGGLDGDARALVEEAREALGELAEMRRDVASEAMHACADWAAASLRRQRLADFMAILDAMREAVTARYSAGGGALADVARVEHEHASAERMVRRAEGDIARAAESLRARLGVDASVSLGEPPALAAEPPTLHCDTMLAYARAHRGLLLAARARIDAASARADAADARASVPTFMLGGMYMQTPQARAGLGLELGMTMPWFWSGEHDAADAARAERQAEEAETRGLERDIEIEVRTALAELDTISATLDVLREREAPATRLALDAVAATYAAAEGSLLDWLDAARSTRELALDEAELLGDVAHALADVTMATGALPHSFEHDSPASGPPR